MRKTEGVAVGKLALREWEFAKVAGGKRGGLGGKNERGKISGT